MIKKLRRINTIDAWYGVVANDDAITHAEESIFIAKNENDSYGMVAMDNSVFLPCNDPLYGILLIIKQFLRRFHIRKLKITTVISFRLIFPKQVIVCFFYLPRYILR